MLKNKKIDTFYKVLILHERESLNNKYRKCFKKIENSYKEDIVFEFIDLKDFEDEIKIPDKRNSKVKVYTSAYYRVFIHKFIKYDKVLYIDVDMLILGDLYKVYQTDLADNYLGAVKDFTVASFGEEQFSKHIGNKYTYKKENTFNGGFLLLNLKKIREANLDDKLMELCYAQLKHPNQDLMNIVYKNKVIFFHPKYNLDWNFFDEYQNNEHIANLYLKMYSKKELETCLNEALIIHYVGSFKPWNIYKIIENKNAKNLELWHKYFTLSYKYIPKNLLLKYKTNFILKLFIKKLGFRPFFKSVKKLIRKYRH